MKESPKMTQHYATFQKDLMPEHNVCYTTCPDLIIQNLIAHRMSYSETSHYVV